MNKSQVQELFRDWFGMRQKPRTLQMPITSRCNSRCKTCNVWKNKDNTDIDPDALRIALKDPFFNEVTGVGLNGGEFTLMPNFVDIVDAVLTLPKIRSIYLISNGILPKRLFEYTRQAYLKCKEHNVYMHLCLSVDGVGKVHDNVRGVDNIFFRTKEILDRMQIDRKEFCSSFSVGCTLSIHNIDYVQETKAFLQGYPDLRVEYHCAIPNKRIKTFDDAPYYVAKYDQKRLLAAEFFYEQFLCSRSYQDFANYYFLKTGCKQRLNTCAYRYRDVTIDEHLNLSLCATASNIIGSLLQDDATTLVHSKRIKEVEHQVSNYCRYCGHYSYHPLNFHGRIAYIKELLKNDYLYDYFKIYGIEKTSVRYRKMLKLYVKAFKRTIIYSYLFLWKLQ